MNHCRNSEHRHLDDHEPDGPFCWPVEGWTPPAPDPDRYASAVVSVTWTLDAVTDGGTRTDLVNLRHGRAVGRSDDDTIRRIVAYKWGSLAYREHVVILAVEAIL